MMFWCLGGRYLAQFAPEHAKYQSEDAQLCRELITRLQQGFYPDANIYFDPEQDSPVRSSEYSDCPYVLYISAMMYAVVRGSE